VHELV